MWFMGVGLIPVLYDNKQKYIEDNTFNLFYQDISHIYCYMQFKANWKSESPYVIWDWEKSGNHTPRILFRFTTDSPIFSV